ncbi:GTP binding protein TypA [Daphnia sinensis]|uniref:GTP binding protein TypA n=1 Tax=Daphnia sinensis TaxID=1820382 RepID=A0AAD5KUQ8_9CRUS|nr:GTP binding protein TypA [Daphnia sinensis]
MRREGYELQVGQPQVIFKEIDGVKCEPIELLVVDVPQETAGKVIELATQRKGELTIMEPKGDLQHLEFRIPSRGLIAFQRNDSRKNQRFDDCHGNGPCTAYAIDKLQDRGVFFVDPGDDLYIGQVVGEHSRDNDIVVNIQKGKKLTNMRASGSDDNVRIIPAKKFSLEESMEYIQKDEYLEITPKSIRMRKIYLDENERGRMAKKDV